MKAYLITTGSLFGLMAVLHVWRAIAEWPHPTVGIGFALGMTALIAVPAILSWWAFRCLRNLSHAQSKLSMDKTPQDDSPDSAHH
jgi:hypothetical protein